MFFLAKELGMTIKQLTENLTREELIAWAGFFELKHEEEEKYKEQVLELSVVLLLISLNYLQLLVVAVNFLIVGFGF